MRQKKRKENLKVSDVKNPHQSFHLEFLNEAQKLAYEIFQVSDVLFLVGPPGTSKTHLACAFALSEVLTNKKEKIFITRPIVESSNGKGKKGLGFLPGTFQEKTNVYNMPIFRAMDKLVGVHSPLREKIAASLEISPLEYMRGSNFENSICILDEAQCCNASDFKLYLSRMCVNAKLIITGDPTQSDLPDGESALMEVVKRLETLQGVGVVQFNENNIVRHKMVKSMLKRLEDL